MAFTDQSSQFIVIGVGIEYYMLCAERNAIASTFNMS